MDRLTPRSVSSFMFFGGSLELYTSWLIGSSVDGEVHRFFPNPRYLKGNREVCDGIGLSGTHTSLLR
jgi:hypothetical protein